MYGGTTGRHVARHGADPARPGGAHADDVTYFLGRETIIVTRREGMAIWREPAKSTATARTPASLMLLTNTSEVRTG